ncbi:hypothetical protein FBEOM_9696 [Fusarium beomiforme]|uniref:Uncharacterized protein n=1 Tax=Fusarium beomiforme TaxID=44412 RepID=A0A9P5ADY4_9HYPO|nr:hypothetical protein FBEOM_9696 [Fusarium beomiforme]
MELSPETHSLILPLISIVTSALFTLICIMCYFLRHRQRLPDEESVEMSKPSPNSNLQRGILVEIACIYRDGIEIYNRDKTPNSQPLYYHPSFEDPEQAHMFLEDILPPRQKSTVQLQRELRRGLRQVDEITEAKKKTRRRAWKSRFKAKLRKYHEYTKRMLPYHSHKHWEQI